MIRSSRHSVSHHGIITQFVHEMRSLGSLVVVEPDRPLELVSGVQQQHVALGAPDLLDHRGSPGHPGETPAAAAAAFSGVLAGLLHPGVYVVGVEENEVPGRRDGHGEAQQEEEAEAEPRHSAPLRAHRSHLSEVRCAQKHRRRKPEVADVLSYMSLFLLSLCSL